MGFLHQPKNRDAAARDARIALHVVRKLRRIGWDARLFDKRDLGGARLHACNVRCGECLIAVRAVGNELTPWEATQARALGAYYQEGAADVSGLDRWLTAQASGHWNAQP